MRETRAILFLRLVAGLAVVMVIVGRLTGRGELSHLPSHVQDLTAQLRQGTGDGYMGLVVLAVLSAPPVAMMLVAIEGRKLRPRHLWIALSTLSVLLLSALLSAFMR